MASVEEDFPRGGEVKKTAESKATVERIKVDNLFQSDEQTATKKRKGAKDDKKLKKQKAEQKEGGLTLNAAARTVEILEGMLFLGCVKEVTDFEVTVGLPCGLQGFLSIRNICDSYTKLLSQQLDSDFCSLSQIFSPGMLLRCAVCKLDITKGGSLSIQLSVNPKLVNKSLTSSSLTAGMVLSGCVESVEDHGTLIDIGVGGTKAFLPEDATRSKEHKKLKVGQYVTCRVEEVKIGGRVVWLSSDPADVAQASANAKQGWNLSNLVPGLAVKATVKKVTKHGLLLDFLSSFSGQVDFLHMEPGQESSYTEGLQVRARVLYVEPSSRLIGLSLRGHLLQPGSDVSPAPPDGDRVGEVVRECRVTALHHMSGAVVELPDKSRAFAHVSKGAGDRCGRCGDPDPHRRFCPPCRQRNHLKEPSDPANDNKVSAAPELACRILDFSPMEQIYFVSLRKSVIDQQFFRYQDIHTGQVVEGTVSVLLSHGMVVHLSEHVKGLVPRTHLSDIILKNPEKKYVEGMRVKCRVTNLKFTVNITVQTFNNLLHVLGVDGPVGGARRPSCRMVGEMLHIALYPCIHQYILFLIYPLKLIHPSILCVFCLWVLKAKVLQCEPEKEKMLLSFKAVAEGDTEEPSVKHSSRSAIVLLVTQRLEARVVKKSNSGLEVVLLPDEVRAALPTMHLSDHMSNCQLLWESLQEGDTISNLVSASRLKMITKKPRVRWSLEEGALAKDFSEISVGMQLIGWIKNIMSYGVFVEFPYGLVGLAPKSAMSDKFVADTTAAFALGQTVIARVTNLDEEKRRFLVTLKMSEVITPSGDAQTGLLNGLQERRAVKEMLAARGALLVPACGVGQRVTLSEWISSPSTPPSDGICPVLCFPGVNLTPGQKVSAVILNVDILSACVHVSLLPKLLGKKKSLNEGADCSAVVQFVDQDFAVVSLSDAAQLTLIETRPHLNDVILSQSERLKVGMTLTVEVVAPSCEQLEGLPLVLWTGNAPRRRRTPSESQTDSSGHRFGEIVQGKVRSVKPTCIQVALEDGSVGSVHVSQVVEPAEVRLGSFPTSTARVGSAVKARVIGGREATSHRLARLDGVIIHNGKYRGVSGNLGIVTKLIYFCSETKTPHICFLFGACFQDANHPEKLYKLGQAVRAKVVEASVQPRRFVLSLTGVHKLEKGGVTLGMVTSVQPQVGLQVKLPFGNAGTVSVTDLADSYRPNPLETFSKDQFIRCCLLDVENGKWHLSLRPLPSRLNPQKTRSPKDPEVLSLDQLQPGQIVRGYVKSVCEQGVFIRYLLPSFVFLQDHSIFSNHLPVNALLTTKILREDELVDLSLLPADTGKPDVLPESLGLPPRLVGDEKKRDGKKAKKRSLSESKPVTSCFKHILPAKETEPQIPKKKKKKKSKTDGEDSGVEVYFREEEEEEEEVKHDSVVPGSAGPSRLQVAAGFSWDVGLNSLKPTLEAKDGDSSDGEEQDGNDKPQKKSRHGLEQEKKSAEKALAQREAELMDPNLRPQDAAAFERLLLASPNSSLLWLQYMAHHLQATEIEQARAVAERALKTISFREEQEKLNVWVALLNLENMYGTEESLKKVFERAVQFCEPMPVYQQLADIYAKSDKTKEAEGLYKKMVKRFRDNKAVWLSYGSFLLQQGQGDAASALLQRALNSLPPKESVDVITKFAQLEFRFGDAEKGRNMFDKVLTTYPKRTDLWSVFIDLMVKHGSQKEVRALFDRVIHLSVSVKKIKFFFKRYLEYEKKHGTPQSVQAVKEKAMEFVEAKGKDVAN
uniref:Protein RRP5 homolog n=1 Tax=Fundulus heteroclitus TaxID=8078 RepID=A0A3Q2R2T8_FUNHE